MSFGSRHRSGIVGFILLYVAFLISLVDRSAISLALAQIGKDFDLQAADLGIIISASSWAMPSCRSRADGSPIASGRNTSSLSRSRCGRCSR